MKKKFTSYVFLATILLLLFTVLVSFAYFSANIQGQETEPTLTVKGGKLEIYYAGGPDIIKSNMSPEDTPFADKIFSVKGNSTIPIPINYSLSLVVKTNTFSDYAISYNLSLISSTGTGTTVSASPQEMCYLLNGPQIENLGNGLFPGPTSTNEVHTYNLKMFFPDLDEPQDDDQKKTINAYIGIEESTKEASECKQPKNTPRRPGPLKNYILIDNGGSEEIELKTLNNAPDFNSATSLNEGMFSIPDDYGTSYYFRGAVDNNWIKFAGYYWRIIRINGDGSVRVIYSGPNAPTSSSAVVMTGADTQIGTSAFNSPTKPYEMAGYMFEEGVFRGAANSSIIKNYLEDWYENNLTQYDDYIEDAIFCSDRRATTDKTKMLEKEVTPVGMPTAIFTNWFSFPDARMHTASEPLTLACFHKDDAYTKYDNVLGNANLSEKVGLITVDEAKISGLKYQVNNSDHYLRTDNAYWFLTISYAGATLKLTNNHTMYANGRIYYENITNSAIGVRPVISLKADLRVNGFGTWESPYEFMP